MTTTKIALYMLWLVPALILIVHTYRKRAGRPWWATAIGVGLSLLPVLNVYLLITLYGPIFIWATMPDDVAVERRGDDEGYYVTHHRWTRKRSIPKIRYNLFLAWVMAWAYHFHPSMGMGGRIIIMIILYAPVVMMWVGIVTLIAQVLG